MQHISYMDMEEEAAPALNLESLRVPPIAQAGLPAAPSHAMPQPSPATQASGAMPTFDAVLDAMTGGTLTMCSTLTTTTRVGVYTPSHRTGDQGRVRGVIQGCKLSSAIFRPGRFRARQALVPQHQLGMVMAIAAAMRGDGHLWDAARAANRQACGAGTGAAAMAAGGAPQEPGV